MERSLVTTFHGKYYYSLDPKGRVMIPAPLRDIIFKKYNNSKLYITNTPFDKSLDLYPAEEWARLSDRVRTLPKSDDAVQFYLRRVVAPAVVCEIDKQGRILVPYEMRHDAGIDGDVVIVGMVDLIQIWNKTRWDEVTDPSKVDVRSFKASLAGFGL